MQKGEPMNAKLRPYELLAAGMILLAALGGCAAPSPPPPITAEQREWTAPIGVTGIQLLTDHYDLRVTAKDAVLLEYLAPFMETACSVWRQRLC